MQTIQTDDSIIICDAPIRKKNNAKRQKQPIS